jgi:PAS domain S-box-containing protein
MPVTPLPLPLRSVPAADILADLLAVSLTGIIYYTPIYEPAGEIIDFTFEYLNPAAQRMMHMPERPTLTHKQQWPHSVAHGTFDFHVEAFLTGEPREYNINYQADGYDNYYRLAARRSGEGLLVSFTDTADQPRTPVEMALRTAQVAEKAARAEAESQRQRFYEMLMQLPAHVAVHEGPHQVFTLVNPYYQRIAHGRELLGQPIRAAWPELVSQGILDELDHVYRTGEPFSANELPIRADFKRTGQLEQMYYNFFFLALRDAQGQVNGVLNFSYDVTDSVRARQQVEQLNQELEARVQERTQAALAAQAEALATAQRLVREREAFYQVFEQTPAAVALLRSPGHRFVYVNPTYQQLFPDRQLLGLDVVVAVPELINQGYLALLDRVYQTGETFFGTEFPFVTASPDGQLTRSAYYNFTYQAYREGNEIAGISVFAFDVTAQKQATDALRESEARFRIMADAAPNQVWAVNPDSTIRYVNRAFLEFVGVSLEQYVRTGWAAFMHPDEIAAAQHTLEEAIRTRSLYTIEHRMRRHDGEYRWLLAQGAPSFYPTGELYGYVGSAIDITEFKRTNEQLVRTNVDLDNFIYTASHDLKAPISNIEGLLHTLRSELPPQSQAGEVSYILDLMQDSVNRFTRTIEHLTDVSRLQKEYSQPPTAVPLADIIEDVRLDLAPLLTQTGGLLRVEVQAVPTILFSEKNLRSVVYNLLSNALKYHHPDRTAKVHVRSRKEGDYHVLEVQDNGLGLDLTRDQQLFTMFRRYHTHVDGSGIGLYMVKRMVENAGGRITVQSEVGQGATFSVYFPC